MSYISPLGEEGDRKCVYRFINALYARNFDLILFLEEVETYKKNGVDITTIICERPFHENGVCCHGAKPFHKTWLTPSVKPDNGFFIDKYLTDKKKLKK